MFRTFSGGAGILPFNDGVVLTTGRANQLPGPNTGSGLGDQDLFSGQGAQPGDAQLSAYVGAPTFNVAVLEFSFVPTQDVISFQYIFGSEEYNEFVGSEFNDIFAFFLNGTNIALIPGTPTPIRINTVNAGAKSAYFTDNTLQAGAPLDTKLDGLVGVRLSLLASGRVNPGVQNAIRLAIADVSDASFDSAVFIRAGSFVNEPPSEIPEPSSWVLCAGALAGLLAWWRRK